MGFLLYAGRKLQLKAKINQLSYRQMQLSQEQQTIASQIADKQQAIQAAKNQLSTSSQMFVLGNVLSGLSSNDTVKQLLNSKGLATCSSQDLQALLNGQKISAGGQEISLDANDFSQIQPIYSQVQYQSQMQASYATNVINSVMDATSKVELAQLQNKDSQISMELENIDSQLKLVNAEYENCKKAESSEAQNTAPSFGLA
ncbi:hypothetical protein IJ818_05705 [bacterium]|nr:hypothetical protein [bacterium]